MSSLTDLANSLEVSKLDARLAKKRIDELETALRALLENVEEFDFAHISIEHELAHGVQLARKALGPVCSICRRRHGTEVVHGCE